MDPDGSALGRWRDYAESYVLSYPTEWALSPPKGGSPVFLQRYFSGILLLRVTDDI